MSNEPETSAALPPGPIAAHGTAAPEQPGRWQSVDWACLTAVLLIALSVRVTYIFQLRASPDFNTPTTDAEYTDHWARAVARGDIYVHEAFFRAPLNAWVMSLAYHGSADGLLAARLLQSVLGTATCGLLFVIGRMVFNRRVGLLAGLGATCYWTLVHFEGELVDATLGTMLNVLLVLLLLKAGRANRTAWWIASGIVLGLSAIARANVLLFAPFIALWLLLDRRLTLGRRVGLTTLLTAATLVPILPVTIRNYTVGHDLVLINSAAGANLWIGNNPQADGCNVWVPGTPRHKQDTTLSEAAKLAERETGRAMKPSEISRHYWKKAFAYIAENPWATVKLTARKLRYFLSAHEFGNNKDLYLFTQEYGGITRYLPLGFGAIAPLGMLGFLATWPRRRELFPLWGYLATYTAAIVIFFVTARYRLPVAPVLILYGAAGVDWLIASLARGRWFDFARGAAALALLALFCNSGSQFTSVPGALETNLATRLAREGRIAEAAAEYRKALELNPKSFEAHNGLAAALAMLNQPDEALQHVQRALEVNPDYAEGHFNLASLLAQQRRMDEAVAGFRRCIELDPGHVEARRKLALALMVAGRVDEAETVLRESVDKDGGTAETWSQLGMLDARRGRVDAAVESYRKALAADPANIAALDQLAILLATRGRAAEAVALLREAMPRATGHPYLAARLAQCLIVLPDPTPSDLAEAVHLAESACDAADGRADPLRLHVLASVYARSGRPADAVRTAERALPLAQQRGMGPLAGQLQALIQAGGVLPGAKPAAATPTGGGAAASQPRS